MSDPQALHTELLELAKPPVAGSIPTALTLYGPAAALTAVLELHKLDYDNNPFGQPFHMCAHCGYGDDGYPCQTVRVIASALGVVADG
jgi:hypothetical protein